MGGQLEGTQQKTSQNLKKYLFTLCSYMVSIGMPTHEYWDEDVDLVNCYIEAENMRLSRLNSQAWLEGVYIQQAIASCLSKNHKYPKKPYPITKYETEQDQSNKIKKLKDTLKAKSKK